LKKREQIESELRAIIKGSKKNIFVKLSLTELINSSRRMYVIYDNFKSGEKFKINNNDENLQLLTDIVSDFKNLNLKIKKIPKPIKDLLDRKWEKEPNSKESIDGSTAIIYKDLSVLHKDFEKLVSILIKDTKSGKINNVDPVPIAIMHAAMIIWVEVLKNKYNLKNEKLLSKNLLIYLKNVFNAFDYEADIKKSYYNWHLLKNMS
jgi:hypothetical protein